MDISNLIVAHDRRGAISTGNRYNTSEFWERLWRTSGIQFVILALVAYAGYAYQARVGSSSDALVGLHIPQRTAIFISAIVSALAALNLMWFAAALRTTLADTGRDGWGAAVTASSATTGSLIFPLIAVGTTLGHSVAGSGSPIPTTELGDFVWSGVVLSSFPRAMLIMAGTFGLWRARLIDTMLFAAGVAAVILVLLGGTTWMSGGFWAPDGAYSRFVSPLIGLAWIMVVSRILLTRSPATRAGW